MREREGGEGGGCCAVIRSCTRGQLALSICTYSAAFAKYLYVIRMSAYACVVSRLVGCMLGSWHHVEFEV